MADYLSVASQYTGCATVTADATWVTAGTWGVTIPGYAPAAPEDDEPDVSDNEAWLNQRVDEMRVSL